MIAGNSDKRFIFGGLKKLAKGAVNAVKNLFRKKGKKVPAKKIEKAIEQAKLTGKPPKLPVKLPAPTKPKVTNWHTKLLAWDWKQFVKGYKFEGSALDIFVELSILCSIELSHIV